MGIYTLIKVNRLIFLSLVIGSIGWVNLQTHAPIIANFIRSTHAEDHRGSGRCDNGCPSSQSFNATKVARRGSGRIDSNETT